MSRVSIDNTPKVRAKPTLRRLDDAARAEQQARFLQLRVNIIKAEQCGIFSAEAAHEARRAVALETARQMREARELEEEELPEDHDVNPSGICLRSGRFLGK